MPRQRTTPYLYGLLLVGLIGLFSTGCMIQDPAALTDLYKARDAIATAKKAGAADQYPERFAALEKQYNIARGTFYACHEKKASEAALLLITEANDLAVSRVEPPKAPGELRPTQPINQKPSPMLAQVPEQQVGELVQLDASGSSDAEGKLRQYHWQFGDGETDRSDAPAMTHRYAAPGEYTARLTVEDDQGETASTTTLISVMHREVVHFDFNQAKLLSDAKKAIAILGQEMSANADLRATIYGYTDAVGTEAYNLVLSQRRAAAVTQFLVQMGIETSRITYTGKGEEAPIASNETEVGRSRNRRAETTVRVSPTR